MHSTTAKRTFAPTDAPLSVQALRDGEIHIWLCNCDVPLAQSVLSPDEESRVGAFRSAIDRHRFLVRRCWLRQIVARYLAVSPTALAFETGEYGKPSLVGRFLNFNTAHAANLAAVAITAAGDIGVDIEHALRTREDWDAVASIAFHPNETSWAKAGGEKAEARFYQLWSVREALFKGWGKGLHDSMRTTSVVGGDHITSNILDAAGKNWTLQSFDPFPGFVGAIAASFPITSVRLFSHTAAIGVLS